MRTSDPLILGHRGGSADAPENTLPAFARALADGAHGVEFDVQLSRDGRLVVIHDFVLGRTANGAGRVVDTAFEDLRRLDAGAWFAPSFAGARIPSLPEALDVLRGRARCINIEIKKPAADIPVEDVLAAALATEAALFDALIVSSFDHRALRRFKSLCPEVHTGILYVESLVEPHAYARTVPADALHPRHDAVTADVVKAAHAAAMAVNVWTVNEPNDARTLRALGVDAIMTDRPAALLAALAPGASGS